MISDLQTLSQLMIIKGPSPLAASSPQMATCAHAGRQTPRDRRAAPPRPWALEAVVERVGTLKRGGDVTRDHNQTPGAPPRQRAHGGASRSACGGGPLAGREGERPSVKATGLGGGLSILPLGDQRNTRTTSRHSSPQQPGESPTCVQSRRGTSERTPLPPSRSRTVTPLGGRTFKFVSRFRATPSAHATPVNCVAASPPGPAESKPSPQHVPSTGDPERPTYLNSTATFKVVQRARGRPLLAPELRARAPGLPGPATAAEAETERQRDRPHTAYAPSGEWRKGAPPPQCESRFRGPSPKNDH